ncbi:MAG: hypothetical protein ACI9N1_002645 [Flavobacteriales bacterium]|jgi:hypothetical protein
MLRRNITILLFSYIGITSFGQFNRDNATLEDSILVSNNMDLIKKNAISNNYNLYYNVAESFYKCRKDSEAELMFLNILDSEITPYSKSYIHSSDVQGDTNTNKYGYGSRTSDYKNSSCLTLAELYIDQKKYSKAFHYVSLADSTHKIIFNCGTGKALYRRSLNDLYAICYDGMGDLDKVVQLLLPRYWDYGSDKLIEILKRNYTKDSLQSKINYALENMIFTPDSDSSQFTTTENYGEENERKIEFTYLSGKGAIVLFGVDLKLQNHLLSKESVTKESLIADFKSTNFYTELTDDHTYDTIYNYIMEQYKSELPTIDQD